MLYEMAAISSSPLEQNAVTAAAYDWVLDGQCFLLGAWRTEIGNLVQIKPLRGFETAEALKRALLQ